MSKFLSFINEKLLVSEFKFGFEFECMAAENMTHEMRTSQYLPQGCEVGGDGSIQVPDKLAHQMYDGIELKSKPTLLTPKALENLYNFLIEARDNGVMVNPTCGFHVHFSFPRMTDMDMLWIMFIMGNTPKMYEMFRTLKDHDVKIPFVQAKYASDEPFKEMKKLGHVGESGNASEYAGQLINLFIDGSNPGSEEKKRQTFRLHPQGTIEWRGPRNFLIGKGPDIIRTFTHRIYEFAKMCSAALEVKEMKGLTRADLEDEYSYKFNGDTPLTKKGDPRLHRLQDKQIMGQLFKKYPVFAKMTTMNVKNMQVAIRGDKFLITDTTFESADLRGIGRDVIFSHCTFKFCILKELLFESCIASASVVDGCMEIGSGKFEASECTFRGNVQSLPVYLRFEVGVCLQNLPSFHTSYMKFDGLSDIRVYDKHPSEKPLLVIKTPDVNKGIFDMVVHTIKMEVNNTSVDEVKQKISAIPVRYFNTPQDFLKAFRG